ncbi:restriction endonuclease subunit S [Lacibacter sp.]|uniref:restriction endonuclease subunit S n=1 Tax=Lacibacter sp. TaxID=1915409 RepID=UPI002B4ACDB6|nr:restriction endonuclease subunit S [Lacibacter sp.]HLP37025.1 restriction endonuclease subunit S [Lacibacter sp.]
MRSHYKQLGNYIKQVDERNTKLAVDTLLGVSIEKVFMPSIANTIGTDMSTYKIVKRNQFAYGPVTSRNGDKISIALQDQYNEVIVSQAYTPFEIIDTKALLPEYLMMWFRRPEFDRYARFMSHGSAREIFEWDEMCKVTLPVPHPDKQKEIVKEYNAIVNRINLNNQLIQKLEETAQAVYKQWFVDFEFPDENGQPYKSSGGEMVFKKELEKEVPKKWTQKQVQEIAKVVDSLHTTPDYASQGLPMVRVTDVNSGFLDLANTMLVDNETFEKFSKNHKSKKGDIVVSRVGATFGEFSYAHTDEKFCLGQNTAVIIPTILDSKLLYTALTTSDIRNQIEAKAVGSAYSTLSLQDIKELTLTLPDEDFELITHALAEKFDILFINRSLCCQENWSLIRMQRLLLSKLATVEN